MGDNPEAGAERNVLSKTTHLTVRGGLAEEGEKLGCRWKGPDTTARIPPGERVPWAVQ